MGIWDFDYDLDNIWMYSDLSKAIFKIDIRSGCITGAHKLDIDRKNSYRGINYYNNNIYLAPQNESKEILIYNTENETINTKAISEKYMPEGMKYNLFTEIVRYDSKLFFLPGRYKAIICLDTESGEITYIDEWYDAIREDLKPEESNLVIFNGVSRIDDERILLVGWKSSVSLVIDMKKCSSDIIKYNSSDSGLRGAILVDDLTMLAYKKYKGIYLFDENHNKVEQVCELHGRLYLYNDRVYVVDSNSLSIFRFNRFAPCGYEAVYQKNKLLQDENPFLLVKQYYDKLVALNSNRNTIIIMDMAQENVNIVEVSNVKILSMKMQLEDNDYLIDEKKELGLDYLIDFLTYNSIEEG